MQSLLDLLIIKSVKMGACGTKEEPRKKHFRHKRSSFGS